ncbi:MAG: type II toxin-antitoxin system RelE/ParE family toxin [Candidatus Promineofilum sp.]|jgi:mRNA interferase RelE/StbE|nr:type II toxin-antitoxin system RelE/ParE family toxin [Promineifilum sp.]MCW5864913.1 type II toxin-antitoxin system RelE/ParE family toxin [Anaerolineae bacterium]
MASYRIEWKSSAARELKRLPRDIIPRIVAAVDALAANAFPQGVVRLKGSQHTYRIRVGDYRVIYTVEDDALRIEIVRVGHRRDVYR